MESRKQKKEKVNLKKIVLVFFLLAFNLFYIGLRLGIKPEIWGVITLLLCLLVSKPIVNWFFPNNA